MTPEPAMVSGDDLGEGLGRSISHFGYAARVARMEGLGVGEKKKS